MAVWDTRLKCNLDFVRPLACTDNVSIKLYFISNNGKQQRLQSKFYHIIYFISLLSNQRQMNKRI